MFLRLRRAWGARQLGRALRGLPPEPAPPWMGRDAPFPTYGRLAGDPDAPVATGPPDSDYAYGRRLADFIIDHIGKPYTADECGRVLEVRPEPFDD